MSNKKIKRLFFDIETSPNVGLFWSAGIKQTIDYDNILEERAIICICFKWEGKGVQYLTWDKHHNDKSMLEKFIKIANTADELVGHNGDKYDLAWIRTRCLFHRIPMFPSYTTVDTLKVSRSKFRFNSNRLDYISKYLGIGKKIKTGGFDLWKKVMLNDAAALKKMVNYCKGDVRLLEDVYSEMRNHIPPKTSVTQERRSCPECGSNHSIIHKRRISGAGLVKIQMQCQDCGKFNTIPGTKK